MDLLSLTPASFVDVAPVLTRRSLVTARYLRPTFIEDIKYAFAINTQRTLELSFWWISAPAVANNLMPEGSNFLAMSGADWYVVGDGQEGEQVLRVNLWMPPGYFCVSGNNLSALNPHTMDTRLFASQRREVTGWMKSMSARVA
jgi:hypothetical protein